MAATKQIKNKPVAGPARGQTNSSKKHVHSSKKKSSESKGSAAKPSLSKSHTEHGEIVTELNEYDVVFGRGNPVMFLPGNIHFRMLVWAHRDQYQSFPGKDKAKTKIAEDIVKDMMRSGGRALALKPTKTNPNRFITVPMKRIVEKACQALREIKAEEPNGYKDFYDRNGSTNSLWRKPSAFKRPSARMNTASVHLFRQTKPKQLPKPKQPSKRKAGTKRVKKISEKSNCTSFATKRSLEAATSLQQKVGTRKSRRIHDQAGDVKEAKLKDRDAESLEIASMLASMARNMSHPGVICSNPERGTSTKASSPTAKSEGSVSPEKAPSSAIFGETNGQLSSPACTRQDSASPDEPATNLFSMVVPSPIQLQAQTSIFTGIPIEPPPLQSVHSLASHSLATGGSPPVEPPPLQAMYSCSSFHSMAVEPQQVQSVCKDKRSLLADDSPNSAMYDQQIRNVGTGTTLLF